MKRMGSGNAYLCVQGRGLKKGKSSSSLVENQQIMLKTEQTRSINTSMLFRDMEKNRK